MSKLEQRKHYRNLRKRISAAYREQAGIDAARLLTKFNVFLGAQHIACYISTKEEFDSNPIIEAVWQNNKFCYLPIINQENEKKLTFVLYQYGDALHYNSYKILEPADRSNRFAPLALDLVILPLVAFDLHGGRLGMGVGYYDRTFAFLQTQSQKKPQLMGLGFSLQETDKLETTALDVPLNFVLTENKLITMPIS